MFPLGKLMQLTVNVNIMIQGKHGESALNHGL